MNAQDKPTLRWGLLSTARINRALIPAIRQSKRSQLLAVASRDRARADSYAREWDIPRAHGSYQALLDDPEVDVLYIPLPNSMHAEWTVRAAQAGKHVLCEKPLALSTAECDRIIAAAEQAGVVVAEAVMYLYHPLLRLVRQQVHNGAVGQVQLVRGSFSFPLEQPANVRWRPDLGGGSLWDVGSYPVSFIRWIAGEPQEVFGWQILSDSGVDESFVGLLRYESGTLGSFNCSFRQSVRTRVEISGTEGRLVCTQPFRIDETSTFHLFRGEQEEEIALPGPDAYVYEVEALAAAVLDGAELPVPLSGSRANVAVIETLYRSAREGLPQKIHPA
ncbi:MAG: Gfo/Idh/MocA family oxidoreductase [Chloroflexia bacterium]|nr:Gfo/Idh/MocA family oxidoreductase [Chloroflexia bacterium]